LDLHIQTLTFRYQKPNYRHAYFLHRLPF